VDAESDDAGWLVPVQWGRERKSRPTTKAVGPVPAGAKERNGERPSPGSLDASNGDVTQDLETSILTDGGETDPGDFQASGEL